MSTPSPTIAYFDLDKTILATSATFALGSPLRRSGLISTSALARGVVAQLPYLLRGADEATTLRIMERMARFAEGMERQRLKDVVLQALTSSIEPAIYAEALALIRAHHDAHHEVVIVSASLQEMIDPIAELVGADRAIGTRLEIDSDGRYTGRIERCLLHAEKVVAITEDSATRGAKLSDAWAYSDSISDLPMLSAVGHPVAANPDDELRAHAISHGWAIKDFERPASFAHALTPFLPQRLSLPPLPTQPSVALATGFAAGTFAGALIGLGASGVIRRRAAAA